MAASVAGVVIADGVAAVGQRVGSAFAEADGCAACAVLSVAWDVPISPSAMIATMGLEMERMKSPHRIEL